VDNYNSTLQLLLQLVC